MELAKALILAGRDGTDRPWPTAPGGPKHLFPIANRPILFHHLEELRAAGVLEAAIMVEPGSGDAIAQAVGDGRDWGLDVRYAAWSAKDGLRGALASVRDFIGDEPVLVQEGDSLLGDRLYGHIQAFSRERLDALALQVAPDTHGYLLSPRAVALLTGGASRPEHALAGLRAAGGRVRVEPVDGCLPCHGDQADLLDSNRRVLERLRGTPGPGSLEDCTVQGAVSVHPSATVRRTLLRGPVIVGPDSWITDAYIGAYTSIGAGVVIEGCELEYSIVLPGAELRFLGMRMESSVIGRDARVTRAFQLPTAIRMTLGEGAEIVLR